MAIASTLSINWIDLIFVQFICTITVLGTLINFIEPHLPIILTQTFRYGKHSYKGAPSRLVQSAEIPKSFFRHFYVFALLISSGCMWLVAYVYVAGYQTPDTVLQWLDLLCGCDRQIRSNPTTTFLAVMLLFIQCVRRFYETHFVQIFSTSSRMNITHYVVGYYHYFGAFVAILAQAHGFVRQDDAVRDSGCMLQWGDCNSVHWLAVVLFLYAWFHQFESNLILARLRRRPDGSVATQKHLVPFGGFFELVSSPHMMFEVLLYVALYMLLPHNTSWLYVLCWVLTNQIENAWLTHKWYLKTFPDYPTTRRVICPWLF